MTKIKTGFQSNIRSNHPIRIKYKNIFGCTKHNPRGGLPPTVQQVCMRVQCFI